MIAVMKQTDYMKKPTFLKNAWAAFKEVRTGCDALMRARQCCKAHMKARLVTMVRVNTKGRVRVRNSVCGQ